MLFDGVLKCKNNLLNKKTELWVNTAIYLVIKRTEF